MKILMIIATACLLLTTACMGPSGARGFTGQDGVNGQNGAPGAQGPQGISGADGQPAKVVPLCPGTSNYGTFVEVALCINNNLYAVYSANGGFLTYLAPGAYSSSGIGSACSLVVKANCVVE